MSSTQAKAEAAGANTAGKKKFPISSPDVRGALGRSKYWLEMFKFSCYISVPIILMFGFAAGSDNLNWVIKNRSYVVYPPANEKPLPPPEFIMEVARRRREARAQGKNVP